MEDAIKYFKRKLEQTEKNLVTADRRGDSGAVQNLRKKMDHYRLALKALESYDRKPEE